VIVAHAGGIVKVCCFALFSSGLISPDFIERQLGTDKSVPYGRSSGGASDCSSAQHPNRCFGLCRLAVCLHPFITSFQRVCEFSWYDVRLTIKPAPIGAENR